MTLIIEVAPERQTLLDEEAARRGVSPAELAGALLDEMLEDLEDVAEARRRLAQTKPEEYRTLDDLRKALGR